MKIQKIGQFFASASLILGLSLSASEAVNAQNLQIEKFGTPVQFQTPEGFADTIDRKTQLEQETTDKLPENTEYTFDDVEPVNTPSREDTNSIIRQQFQNDTGKPDDVYVEPSLPERTRTRKRQPVDEIRPAPRRERIYRQPVVARETVVEGFVESSAAALGGKITSDVAAGNNWRVGASGGIIYYNDAANGAELDVNLGVNGTYEVSPRLDINAAIDVTARNQNDDIEAIRTLTLNPEYNAGSNRNNDILVGGKLVNQSGGIDAYQDFNRSTVYATYATDNLTATVSAYPFISSASLDAEYEVQEGTKLSAYLETPHTADAVEVNTQLDASVAQDVANNVFSNNDVITLTGGYRSGADSLGNNTVSDGVYIGGSYQLQL